MQINNAIFDIFEYHETNFCLTGSAYNMTTLKNMQNHKQRNSSYIRILYFKNGLQCI